MAMRLWGYAAQNNVDWLLVFSQNSENQKKVGQGGMAGMAKKMDMNDTKPAMIENANTKRCIGQ